MATGIKIGIAGVVKNVKSMHCGVDGAVRKVKKVYVGVGGVAKPCWSTGLEYYGTISGFTPRHEYASTSFAGYAFFGGGIYTDYVDDVEIYNSSLSKVTGWLSVPRCSLACAHNASYAIFGGGEKEGVTVSAVVDAFNSSLVHSLPYQQLPTAVDNLSASSIGNYVLFSGGGTLYDGRQSFVTTYDNSLIRTGATELSEGKENHCSGKIGVYAVFAGGLAYDYTATVDAYNSSLTKTVATTLSQARSELASANIGSTHLLFVGGMSSGAVSDVVDAYTTTLTRSTLTPLSIPRYNLAGSSLGGYAIFSGGASVGRTYSYDVVEYYDSSLTKNIANPLSVGRNGHSSEVTGNYAIVGGGWGGTGASSEPSWTAVDAYFAS